MRAICIKCQKSGCPVRPRMHVRRRMPTGSEALQTERGPPSSHLEVTEALRPVSAPIGSARYDSVNEPDG